MFSSPSGYINSIGQDNVWGGANLLSQLRILSEFSSMRLSQIYGSLLVYGIAKFMETSDVIFYGVVTFAVTSTVVYYASVVFENTVTFNNQVFIETINGMFTTSVDSPSFFNGEVTSTNSISVIGGSVSTDINTPTTINGSLTSTNDVTINDGSFTTNVNTTSTFDGPIISNNSVDIINGSFTTDIDTPTVLNGTTISNNSVDINNGSFTTASTTPSTLNGVLHTFNDVVAVNTNANTYNHSNMNLLTNSFLLSNIFADGIATDTCSISMIGDSNFDDTINNADTVLTTSTHVSSFFGPASTSQCKISMHASYNDPPTITLSVNENAGIGVFSSVIKIEPSLITINTGIGTNQIQIQEAVGVFITGPVTIDGPVTINGELTVNGVSTVDGEFNVLGNSILADVNCAALDAGDVNCGDIISADINCGDLSAINIDALAIEAAFITQDGVGFFPTVAFEGEPVWGVI
jgi:hypothetical protein